MKEDNSIIEMGISSGIVFSAIFLAVLPLTNFSTAARVAFFACLIFYMPFLPLVHKFKGINEVEKLLLALIYGLSYIGIYATLDVFLKLPFTIFTYLLISIVIFTASFLFLYSKH